MGGLLFLRLVYVEGTDMTRRQDGIWAGDGIAEQEG